METLYKSLVIARVPSHLPSSQSMTVILDCGNRFRANFYNALETSILFKKQLQAKNTLRLSQNLAMLVTHAVELENRGKKVLCLGICWTYAG